ncbi:hypothetical protein V1227_09475 [Lentzea sp. DG1S-22]|uniref:hypothetical protein n=1 Tax=Lentzea sp. DG1S-22 TaxID=3108822 RepID=UPI002E78AA5F|nr:hypothetical protein [Lentzea sp. DG1S-22]WVH82960.1 hypothetical protein V1227_09475 [Lentzea sp. DG1S-22]
MSDTTENTWSWRRQCLDDVIDRVRAQVALRGVDLLVQVEPAEVPSAAAVWNWHLTCTAGDVEFDVIASQDLTSFVIEDNSGRFETEADAVTLPDVMTQRIIR